MGARLMLEDDFFERFGAPDYALALHVDTEYVAGTVNLVDAPYASVDSVDIVVKGVAGHGARPGAPRGHLAVVRSAPEGV